MSESIATLSNVTLVGTYNDEDVDFCDNIEIGLISNQFNRDCVIVRTHEDDDGSTVNLTPDEALRMADDLKALAISMGAKV